MITVAIEIIVELFLELLNAIDANVPFWFAFFVTTTYLTINFIDGFTDLVVVFLVRKERMTYDKYLIMKKIEQERLRKIQEERKKIEQERQRKIEEERKKIEEERKKKEEKVRARKIKLLNKPKKKMFLGPRFVVAPNGHTQVLRPKKTYEQEKMEESYKIFQVRLW